MNNVVVILWLIELVAVEVEAISDFAPTLMAERLAECRLALDWLQVQLEAES